MEKYLEINLTVTCISSLAKPALPGRAVVSCGIELIDSIIRQHFTTLFLSVHGKGPDEGTQ